MLQFKEILDYLMKLDTLFLFLPQMSKIDICCVFSKENAMFTKLLQNKYAGQLSRDLRFVAY